MTWHFLLKNIILDMKPLNSLMANILSTADAIMITFSPYKKDHYHLRSDSQGGGVDQSPSDKKIFISGTRFRKWLKLICQKLSGLALKKFPKLVIVPVENISAAKLPSRSKMHERSRKYPTKSAWRCMMLN